MRVTCLLIALALVSCGSFAPTPAAEPKSAILAGGAEADDGQDLPALYDTTAREHGMPSNERAWEVERRPTLSIVRSSTDRFGGALGGAFFLLECFADLSQQRGAAYFVKLADRPLRLGTHADPGNDWEYVIGFTNSPDPDIAAEFPQHHVPGTDYLVLPSANPEAIWDVLSDLPGRSPGDRRRVR